MGKKKKQTQNLVKPRSKNMQYACPFCHAYNYVKVSIRKNNDKKQLEGICKCSACKQENIIPKLRAIDTENNVYSRWCEYARQLVTFGVKCCGAMTILYIQKIGEQTVGIVHCYEEDHEERFIKQESETTAQFKERVQNELNHQRHAVSQEPNKQKKRQDKRKASKQADDESEYEQYSQDEADESYESAGDVPEESDDGELREADEVHRPKEDVDNSDDDI